MTTPAPHDTGAEGTAGSAQPDGLPLRPRSSPRPSAADGPPSWETYDEERARRSGGADPLRAPEDDGDALHGDDAPSTNDGAERRRAGIAPSFGGAPKSKLIAGLLGLLLGTFGAHNFYLGRTNRAVVQLAITLLSLGMLSPVSTLWGAVEGLLILLSQPGSHWHRDVRGVELSDWSASPPESDPA